MKTFFAIVCTSIVIAVMTVATITWIVASDYQDAQEECGADLNETCFVVVTDQ